MKYNLLSIVFALTLWQPILCQPTKLNTARTENGILLPIESYRIVQRSYNDYQRLLQSGYLDVVERELILKDSVNAVHEAVIAGLDSVVVVQKLQIASLEKALVPVVIKRRHRGWWFAGGVVVGILVGRAVR